MSGSGIPGMGASPARLPFSGLLEDRKGARAAGHKVYYRLGFKCLKGHQAPRRVSDGACTGCIQAEKDKVRAAVLRAVEKAKAPERARRDAERAAKVRAKEEAQDARREELKAAREERKRARTAAKLAATVTANNALRAAMPICAAAPDNEPPVGSIYGAAPWG